MHLLDTLYSDPEQGLGPGQQFIVGYEGAFGFSVLLESVPSQNYCIRKYTR